MDLGLRPSRCTILSLAPAWVQAPGFGSQAVEVYHFYPLRLPGFQLFAGYGMVASRPKGWGGMVLTAQD